MKKSIFFICITMFLISCEYLENSSEELGFFVPETAMIGFDFRSEKQIKTINKQNKDVFSLLFKGLDSAQVFHAFKVAKGLSVSLHSTKNHEYEPLFILRTNESWHDTNISSILGKNPQDSTKQGLKNLIDIGFHSFVFENHMAISKSKILIEDFQRAVENEQSRIYFENEKSENIIGFFNGKRFAELGRKLYKTFSKEFILKDAIVDFEIELSKEAITLNGKANSVETNANDFILFGDDFIPIDANFIEWKKSKHNYGLGYVSVEVPVYDQVEKLFVFEALESDSINTSLINKAKQLLSESDSTIYKESYAGEEIGFIRDSYFSSFVTENDLENGAYYAIVNHTLLISSNADVLRLSLASHANEQTLGQSVEEKKFLESLIQDTHYTGVIDFKNGFNESLLEEKSEVYTQITSLLSKIDKATFQVNSSSNGYLVSALVNFADESSTITTQQDGKGSLVANGFLETAATSRVHLLKNHNSNELEVLAQDQNNSLYQFSLQGELNWKIALESQLRAEILQVDYYNNRKLQYLIFTDSLVHIIDRNGNEIEGFPKVHNIQENIEALALIDYDNTKRYRYLVSAGRGDMYMFDKEVNQLEGWEPKSFDVVLKEKPFHARVAGKDFFVVVERANNLHLINRRASAYKGFPANLNMRFAGDVYFDKKPSFSTSNIVAISDDGLLKSINLEGKITGSKQFFKPNEKSSFRLVEDKLNNGYIILRVDDRSSFLTNDEQELFSLSEPLGPQHELFFYRFRNKQEVIMIWNKQTSEVKLYDLNGMQVGETVNSAFKPALLHFSRKGVYQLFVNIDNQVNIYAFSSNR